MSSGGSKPPAWANKKQTLLQGTKRPGRVDLTPADFERLISEKGVRVRVFRTVFCPNVKSIDGAEHNIDCKLCNGSGYLDRHPLETMAFLQAISSKMERTPAGLLDGNSLSATFPAGVELNYFTLVQLLDFTEPFMQRIKRSTGMVDTLKYKATHVNFIVESSGKEYHQETDYALDPNGNIAWKPNRGPLPGTIYSIHFDCCVQFRATWAQHSNRFTQVHSADQGGILHVKLPEQWLITKEFLVKRHDVMQNEILDNPIVDPTDPDEPAWEV